MHIWTPRVTARAKLAEVLRERFLTRAKEAGLLESDLETLAIEGRRAEQADRDQQAQLADNVVERKLAAERATALKEREDALRVRLPAVLRALAQGDATAERQGLWLTHLSFARYRFRDMAPPASEPPTEAVLRAVARVERADALTRFRGLHAFVAALLEPGREAIVEALAARAIPKAELEALRDEALALAEHGPNALTPAEATRVEDEAAGAQQRAWTAVRRMVKRAVAGEPELEALYAAC